VEGARGNREVPPANVELPRTDEAGVSAEGREQPVIEPAAQPPVRDSGPVEGARGNREVPPATEGAATPSPVEDAPDTTTPKQQVEDKTKLEDSGGEG
jgi:hypothetical protein